MAFRPVFPTTLHEQVAALARDFMVERAPVDTVLVVNSCARGTATPDSDLDLAVLVPPTTSAIEAQDLERAWQDYAIAHPLVSRFKQSGRFAFVHLDVFTGEFTPAVWDEGGGPDSFEIEIGNRIAHSSALGETGPWFRELRDRWLPFYDDGLRERRLSMVRDACSHDLAYLTFCSERGLHFQAFDRLYKAFQEFLQALFISRRSYPIAYNKWIRQQVEEWLGLPELYGALPTIISVASIEGPLLIQKANELTKLFDDWIE